MKVLIVRFSSIGDIVLTTPVVRCLKQQVDNIEIHYLTKNNFISVIENNPYIDKIHTIGNDLKSLIPLLKQENFDLVIDLHHNVRTLRLKYFLGKKSVSFNKLNWKKFLITTFKINKLPKQHIVDRYLETINFLGVLILAFLTAVGGGTIRDILINRVPSILVSEFYATVALIVASIIFVLELLHLRSLPTLTLVFIFGVVLRILAYYKKWHLPTLSKE